MRFFGLMLVNSSKLGKVRGSAAVHVLAVELRQAEKLRAARGTAHLALDPLAVAQVVLPANFRRHEDVRRRLHEVAFGLTQEAEALAGHFDNALAELRLGWTRHDALAALSGLASFVTSSRGSVVLPLPAATVAAVLAVTPVSAVVTVAPVELAAALAVVIELAAALTVIAILTLRRTVVESLALLRAGIGMLAALLLLAVAAVVPVIMASAATLLLGAVERAVLPVLAAIWSLLRWTFLPVLPILGRAVIAARSLVELPTLHWLDRHVRRRIAGRRHCVHPSGWQCGYLRSRRRCGRGGGLGRFDELGQVVALAVTISAKIPRGLFLQRAVGVRLDHLRLNVRFPAGRGGQSRWAEQLGLGRRLGPGGQLGRGNRRLCVGRLFRRLILGSDRRFGAGLARFHRLIDDHRAVRFRCLGDRRCDFRAGSHFAARGRFLHCRGHGAFLVGGRRGFPVPGGRGVAGGFFGHVG